PHPRSARSRSSRGRLELLQLRTRDAGIERDVLRVLLHQLLALAREHEAEELVDGGIHRRAGLAIRVREDAVVEGIAAVVQRVERIRDIGTALLCRYGQQ